MNENRLSKRDVDEVLKMLEEELDSIPRLDKLEKMKMRSLIRRQENWLIALADPKPKKVLIKLEGRLRDIFRLYPAGFSDNVIELLDRKVSRLQEQR